MKQVYRIDEAGFYLEPVLVHPEQVPVEVQVPNPNYIPPVDDVIEGEFVKLPESEGESIGD